MKKILCLIFLLVCSEAIAQSSFLIKDGAGNSQTVKSINCSSNICPLSVPVDITGTPLATVSNPLFVTGTFFQATQPVSIASMPSTPVTGTFFQATQPISTAALPLPSGASTEATLALIKAKTDNIDVLLSTRTKPADTQPVSGPVTDTQLRANPVPVSGFPTYPYPATVTPVGSNSAVAANATATATIAAAVGKFNYLTSIQIFATGATAATAVNATITGIVGGTMTIPFDVPVGANLRATPIILDFATPLRTTAVNTAIVVSLPALGAGNTRAVVNAQGYQQ